MAELTVKELANHLQKSTQYIYQLIAKGKLQTVERNGRKYVIWNDTTSLKSPDKESSNDLVAWLQSEVKRLAKENRRLVKKLEKCGKQKEEVLISYIQELKQLQLMHKPTEEIIEAETEEIRPRKKKKKRKNKKHN